MFNFLKVQKALYLFKGMQKCAFHLFLIAMIALGLISTHAQARFLNEDPAAGDVTIPSSLNKYLYAYQNPTVYIDPDGRTAEQFEMAVNASLDVYHLNGSRTALGNLGELQLEKILRANGEIIIKGKSERSGSHNADIITYDPETKKISFFDNKIQTGKASVSKANNLSEEDGRVRNIAEARKFLEEMNISSKMKKEIQSALYQVENEPSKAVWAVANASPEELVDVENKVKRVSQRLVDKGVVFADIVNGKVNILSPYDSANNGKKILSKIGRSIPAAGSVVSAVSAASRIQAAELNDEAYRQGMRNLGISSTVLDNHSVERELAIIAGEEAGGEGGGAAVAAIIAPYTPACGPAVWLCLGAGAIAGGIAGDTIGGQFAAWSFDRNAQNQLSSQLDEISKQILKNALQDQHRISSESR